MLAATESDRQGNAETSLSTKEQSAALAAWSMLLRGCSSQSEHNRQTVRTVRAVDHPCWPSEQPVPNLSVPEYAPTVDHTHACEFRGQTGMFAYSRVSAISTDNNRCFDGGGHAVLSNVNTNDMAVLSRNIPVIIVLNRTGSFELCC